LKKNKTLAHFPAYFLLHNQILESVFQLIFHYTTKHRKIIHFSGIHFPEIHFPKENYFPANKWGLKQYLKPKLSIPVHPKNQKSKIKNQS